MSENLRERFLRIVTLSLLALVIAGGFVMAYPSFRRGQSLRQQNAELDERINAKKREIAALVENQRRFRTDPDFVESIARQNRRVFPGELVFIFEDN